MSVAIKYTESMTAVLNWYRDNECNCATVARIANATGYSRNTVRGNLKQLAAGDHVVNEYESTGEYRLVRDPRDS